MTFFRFAHTHVCMAPAVAFGIDTHGRSLLAQWLEHGQGRSQVLLASWLELNSSSVSLWVSGRSRPEPPMRRALEMLLGIPEDAWLTAEELAFLTRAKATAAALKPKRRRSASAVDVAPASGRHRAAPVAPQTGTGG